MNISNIFAAEYSNYSNFSEIILLSISKYSEKVNFMRKYLGYFFIPKWILLHMKNWISNSALQMLGVFMKCIRNLKFCGRKDLSHWWETTLDKQFQFIESFTKWNWKLKFFLDFQRTQYKSKTYSVWAVLGVFFILFVSNVEVSERGSSITKIRY